MDPLCSIEPRWNTFENAFCSERALFGSVLKFIFQECGGRGEYWGDVDISGARDVISKTNSFVTSLVIEMTSHAPEISTSPQYSPLPTHSTTLLENEFQDTAFRLQKGHFQYQKDHFHLQSDFFCLWRDFPIQTKNICNLSSIKNWPFSKSIGPNPPSFQFLGKWELGPLTVPPPPKQNYAAAYDCE